MSTFLGRFQLLAKPASEWASADPVLLLGEFGVSDPSSSDPLLKCGDGVRPFSALPAIRGEAGPPGVPEFANPSSLIGLTPVNGVTDFAMRADSAPALDQSIDPVWTGQHAFMDVALFGATSAPGTILGASASVQTFGTTGPTSGHTQTRGSNDATGVQYIFAKTRSTAYNGLTAVQDGDTIGAVHFVGADGVDLGTHVASIVCTVDGAVSADTVPGMLAFHTAGPAGGTGERFRFNPYGALGIAGANYGTAGQVFTSGGPTAPATWGPGVTGANPTASIGLAAVNGAAATFMRSDAAPALSQAIAPTWSGAHTFNGAVNVAGIFKLSGTEGTAGQVLVAQGAGLAPQWGAGVTLANPSALIGLAATNGSAATAMRSDAAPALNQGIAPTWTAAHRFNAKADFWGEFRAEGVEGTAGQVWSAQGAGLPPAWRSASGGAIDLGYTFNSGLTAVDPGAQKLSFNASSYAATTIIRFDSLAANNFDASTILSLLTPGNRIYIQGRTDSTKAAVFEVTATATDMTGWWSVPVTLINSRGTLFANNADLTTIFILSSASGATVANPTASIGMTAVNGVLATAMRSDAAPAINPAIIPTWTGQHTFTALITQLSNSGGPVLKLTDTDAGTDATNWRIRNNGGQFILSTENDAGTEQVRAFTFSRTAANISTMDFGNATSNPTYNFLGTGVSTIFGSLVVGGATGGSKGSGTVNAVGLYVNGVAVTALAAANPTALVGTAAVNGSAATFMRSDAAPALDQAIVPTWTGAHTFNSSVTLSAANPTLRMTETDQAADEKNWMFQPVSKVFYLRTFNDVFGSPQNVLAVTRGTGTAIASIDFGNATNNPTYNFLGVGTITAGGPVVFNDQVTTWSATSIQLRFSESDQAADEKNWQFLVNTKLFKLRTLTDAFGGPVDVLSVTRGTGVAITAIDFGNAANNPAYNFLGTGTVTSGGVHLGPNGAVGAPTYSFTNDGNTGIYSGGADVIAYSCGGVLAGVMSSNLWSIGDGTAAMGDRLRLRHSAAPAAGTSYHQYVGLAGTGGPQIDFYAYDGTVTSAGTFRIRHAQVLTADGTGAIPVYSFFSDPDTGFFRAAGNQMGVALAGVERIRFSSGSVPLRLMAADTVGDCILGFYEPDTTTQKGYVGYGSATNDDLQIANIENAPLTFWTNNTLRLTIAAAGAATFVGDVTAASYTTSSARAVKRETGAPKYAADILARLRPILYRLLAGDEREQLGLIAEEVHEVCPQLSDGATVAYDRLALLLLAAWQDERQAA